MTAVKAEDLYTVLRECLRQAMLAQLKPRNNSDTFRAALSGTMTAMCFVAKLLSDVEGRSTEAVLRDLGSPENLLKSVPQLAQGVADTFAGHKFTGAPEADISADDALIDIVNIARRCVVNTLAGPPPKFQDKIEENTVAGAKTGTLITVGLLAQSLAANTGVPVETLLHRMAVPVDELPPLLALEQLYRMVKAQEKADETHDEVRDTTRVH